MAGRVALVIDAPPRPPSRLGIVELVEVCGRERARSLAMFVRTGEWVTATTDASLQRLFAVASHRHAWHAQLWADRLPTIPVAADPSPVPIAAAHDDVARRTVYSGEIASSLDELAALAARIEPELDPSSARVIELVVADLTDLRARLAPSR